MRCPAWSGSFYPTRGKPHLVRFAHTDIGRFTACLLERPASQPRKPDKRSKRRGSGKFRSVFLNIFAEILFENASVDFGPGFEGVPVQISSFCKKGIKFSSFDRLPSKGRPPTSSGRFRTLATDSIHLENGAPVPRFPCYLNGRREIWFFSNNFFISRPIRAILVRAGWKSRPLTGSAKKFRVCAPGWPSRPPNRPRGANFGTSRGRNDDEGGVVLGDGRSGRQGTSNRVETRSTRAHPRR